MPFLTGTFTTSPFQKLVNLVNNVPSSPMHALHERPLLYMLQNESLHAIMMMFTMYVGKRAEKAARDMVDIFQETDKPLMVCWIAGSLAQDAYKILEQAGVPLFKTAGRCVRALRAQVKYSQFLRALT